MGNHNIIDEETVIKKANLHKVILVGPIILTSFFITSTIIISFLARREFISIFLFMSILFILPSILLLVKKIIELNTSVLIITDKKIVFEHGLIFRVSQEHFLNKIEAITVGQGLLGRTFDYGNLVVSGVGTTLGGKICISNPIEIKKIMQNAIKSYV